MQFRSRLLATLVCALVVVPFVAPRSALAQAGLALTINEPNGSGDKIASGRDFASEQLSDPWDMNQITDVAVNETTTISGASVSNGIFSATAANADPAFFMLDPGFGGTQRQGKTGKNFPVDTTLYRFISIRMNVSVASSMQVFWYTGNNQTTSFASSEFVQTTPGFRIYTIDLQTTVITSGTVTSWNGQPATGIRIDPSAASGSTFQIDWVRLTAPGDAGTTYTVNMTPTDGGSNAAVNLYLDDDSNFGNGYIERVAANLREDTTTTAPVQLAKYAPGNYFVTGRLSRDYASLMLEDPWDMSNAGDVISTGGFSSASVSGGSFNGLTNSSDPGFLLNVPTSGVNQIDASVYKSLSFQMTLSSASQYQIFWQNSSGVHFGSATAAQAGSAIYTVNLGADANWTGLISLFRIDPATASGINVSVDWVSVNTGPSALAAAPSTVVATNGPLTLNNPPVATLLQPDASGGLDYAAFIRNNPWNHAEASDIQLTTGLAAGFPQFLPNTTVDSVNGDYMRGMNPNGNGDPAVFYLFENTMQPIDANRFKNLTFRMSLTGPRDVGLGSVARVFWQTTTAGTSVQVSEDIIVNPGLNTYVFDLPSIIKEPGDPNNNGVWGGTVKYFRLDPHEFAAPREFFIDDLKIAADDESNGKFAITWAASDTDDNATISIFRDNDAVGFNGTQIVTGLEENDAGNVYLWDTKGTPNGTYFLYIVITDGQNTSRRYATGRLVVNNGGAADTTPPIGALETTNVVTNASGSVNVQGWTLDNVQVASVQLLIDGTPVARPTTGLFRADIRDANSNFPDCSQSGFQTTYNASGLPAGNHSLTIAVYDTAGNRKLLGGASSGTETAGIYIPASGAWFLRNSNSPGAADIVFTFGPSASTLAPIVGDWDGDGTDTIGLYDPASGAFFLRNSNTPGAADLVFTFGPGGSDFVPITGDWNGDGVDTIGLYQSSNGFFFLKNTNSPGAADLTFGFGAGGGGLTPLAGDWNGDGTDTIGLFGSATSIFFLRNSNTSGNADIAFSYGPSNAQRVMGDWNNDGTDTVGIYVPSTGAWFLRNSNSPGNADIVFSYGPANATPVSGDWNGSSPKMKRRKR